MQPASDSRCSSSTVTPKAGRITTSCGPEAPFRFDGIGQKADALRAQLIVDVRVVDDFAGQKDVAVGKPVPRLIGVVDGAVHAVAEPELTGQKNGQAPGLESVVAALI